MSIPSLDPIPDLVRSQYGFYHPDLIISVSEQWKHGILKTIIKLPCNIVNVRLAIEEHASFKNDRFTFSTFSQQEYWNEVAIADKELHILSDRLTSIFRGRINPKDVSEALNVITRKHEVNEAEAYFRTLPETNSKLLDSWLIQFAGAEDTPITRFLGRKWLISAVARACQPGCYAEFALIFAAEQAAGKSHLFLTLVPKPDWHTEVNMELSNTKGMAEISRGKLFIEMSELGALGRSDINSTKSFLTRKNDTFREAYAIKSRTVERMSVYCGSTNDITFLSDPTGSRRFGIVSIEGKMDIPGLKEAKEGLWKEAYDAYLLHPNESDQAWILTDEERAMLNEANGSHTMDDSTTISIQRALTILEENGSFPSFNGTVTSAWIADVLKRDRITPGWKHIANVMRGLGYESTTIGHKQARGYRKITQENKEIN